MYYKLKSVAQFHNQVLQEKAWEFHYSGWRLTICLTGCSFHSHLERNHLTLNSLICCPLCGPLITTAWHVFRLWVEVMASR